MQQSVIVMRDSLVHESINCAAQVHTTHCKGIWELTRSVRQGTRHKLARTRKLQSSVCAAVTSSAQRIAQGTSKGEILHPDCCRIRDTTLACSPLCLAAGPGVSSSEVHKIFDQAVITVRYHLHGSLIRG